MEVTTFRGEAKSNNYKHLSGIIRKSVTVWGIKYEKYPIDGRLNILI